MGSAHVTLIDTSAWVEWLRDTGSPTCAAVDTLLAGDHVVSTCEPVMFELFVGARDAREDDAVAAVTGVCAVLPVGNPSTWEAAAAAYRMCRRSGETVRSMADCLVAAVALREDVEILHCDRDYGVLARHVPIRQRTA
jgi:predicted nucleic acid-binding protein